MEIPQNLKDSLGKIQQRLSGMASSTIRFYRANTAVSLSAFTIMSVLLIFWARLGFTFDVSRFFAAEVGQLTVQCGATQNVLTWTVDDRANSNTVERGNAGAKNLPDCADYWCWLPTRTFVHRVPTTNVPATYTDTQLQSGVCYEYRVKYQPGLTSNSVFCPQNCNLPTILPAPTPTGTPTPTPTLTPTPSPTPTLTPTPTASPTPSPTLSPSITPSPTPSITPTPVPQGSLGVSMSGKNISTNSVESGRVDMRTGQQAQIFVRVRNTSTQANLNGVVARVSLPSGLEYLPGSTTVGGTAAGVDTLTAQGLTLGAMAPGQESIIAFRVTAPASQFGVGATQLQVVSQIQALNVPNDGSAVDVIVTKPVSGTSGTVSTGPGDALLAAFLISSIITLLYVSYTHTSTYKRREIGSITEDRDPLDFRS
jgi:uncharacterized repeat protein (TIGR01451 family)